MKASAKRWALVAGVLALAGVGAFLMMESLVRQMLYPAPPVRVPSPPPAPLVAVSLEAGGHEVSAWYEPPPDDRGVAAPVVLMLHGNGENLETMRQAGLFEDFARVGAGVLAIDYPGYGRSAGTPSESSNVAAAEAAWAWLRTNEPGRTHLVAGWSLGAAVAAQLAARHDSEVAGVLLLSGWDRLEGIAKLHFPAWLVAVGLSDRYDSEAAARRITKPALVVHGVRDEIIPVESGRRLHAALAGPKEWVEVEGAGHNDLLGRPEAWTAIERFLARRSTAPPG